VRGREWGRANTEAARFINSSSGLSEGWNSVTNSGAAAATILDKLLKQRLYSLLYETATAGSICVEIQLSGLTR